MRLSEFSYNLPKELIAQEPVSPRDHSRLMVLNRKTKKIIHKYFFDLPQFLSKGDILVFNNSKVIPAKLIGQKESGGKSEVLILKELANQNWEIILKARRLKLKQKIYFSPNFYLTIVNKLSPQTWEAEFNLKEKEFWQAINKFGQAPLPPYIKKSSDLKKYQTIYAKIEGSVAAPTAGFHFTENLMTELRNRGVVFEYVTLHVGLGTFQPVREANIEEHKIHKECATLDKETAKRLNQYKNEGRRIVAVGTTAMRVLEFAADKKGQLQPFSGDVDIFIYPGCEFSAHGRSASGRKFFIDALITNFHLPETTLLMLVCAFADKDFITKTYQKAIQKKYRFYSFGDAMLIL